MAKMKRLGGAEVLLDYGRKLGEGISKVANSYGYDMVVSGAPSMPYMRITDDASLSLHQDWVAECVKRGIYFANHHNHFINFAMNQKDLEFTLEVADDAFKALQKRGEINNRKEMMSYANHP